jgi:hypothetical protein
MAIENTVRQLESLGIKVPDRIQNALAVINVARGSRGVIVDATSEVTAAFIGGALTPDNYDELVRAALVKYLTSHTGPQGALGWQVAQAVQQVAENQVRRSSQEVLSTCHTPI